MHTKHTRRPAFTLVELLVVIGIIAVLIGILLPSLAKARMSAQSAVCLSNLRQLVLAASIYTAENKGICIFGPNVAEGTDTIDETTGPAAVNWEYEVVNSATKTAYSFERGFLGRYIKSDKVFECPVLARYEFPPYKPGWPKTAYSMTLISSNRASRIRKPDETANFLDVIGFDRPTQALQRLASTQAQRPGLSPLQGGVDVMDAFHGRHVNGRGNIGFYDGHAESIAVPLRPRSSYYNLTDNEYTVFKVNHIGPATPFPIDASAAGTPDAYRQQCENQLDWYFWANKANKGRDE